PPARYLVVLEEKLAGTGYQRAARRLAALRSGEIVTWNGDWAELERVLLEKKPVELALVLEPRSIDASLPRRLVPILSRLRADPFGDCDFGLITGGTDQEAERFVERIEKSARADLPEKKFETVSVVLDQCMKVGPEARTAAGRKLDTTSLWITGKDKD